jgi:hypothetical protein
MTITLKFEHPPMTIKNMLMIAMPMAMLALPAHGQAPDSARMRELEQKLERSLELIDQLSKKIDKLEQEKSVSRITDEKTTQQSAKIEQLEKHVSELSGGLSRRSFDTGVPIHGFADVGGLKSTENNPTSKGRKGATIGNLDLYLTPQFGDRIKTLVELVFEVESGNAVEADLERLQLGYTFSDSATLWGGRFHTPFGYWNTAFHHGNQIQTAATRPRFLEFEGSGGILPTHTVGAWLTGSRNFESAKLGYDVFVGNAPRIRNVASGANVPTALATSYPTGFSSVVNAGRYAGSGSLSPQQTGSTSQRTSTGFNAWMEPTAVDGLRVGLHGLRADVLDESTNSNRTLLRMTGGYLTYQTEPWELISEYYRFRNADRSGSTGTHGSWAGFAQAGYNIGKWTPFARTERAKLDQTDNYFAVLSGGRSYRRSALGLRYDLDPKAALKFELAGNRKENLGPNLEDRYMELLLQYAVRF